MHREYTKTVVKTTVQVGKLTVYVRPIGPKAGNTKRLRIHEYKDSLHTNFVQHPLDPSTKDKVLKEY